MGADHPGRGGDLVCHRHWSPAPRLHRANRSSCWAVCVPATRWTTAATVVAALQAAAAVAAGVVVGVGVKRLGEAPHGYGTAPVVLGARDVKLDHHPVLHLPDDEGYRLLIQYADRGTADDDILRLVASRSVTT